MKVVFVVGNGFDLDLGWKTQFSHFANSSFWPQRPNGPANLYSMLNHERRMSQWLDVEMLLANYSRAKGGMTFPNNAPCDRAYFEQLSYSLISYLKEQQNLPISDDSIAAKVLDAVLSDISKVKIFSFNYTDLKLVAKKLGLLTEFDYEHVHGCIKDKSVIMGIPDSVDVCDNYEFLYKTFNKHYCSHSILYDLLDADEVIFFGHSLGKIDYHYFQKFFEAQCDVNMKRNASKRISIFTCDDASRMSILKQLREMNQKRTDLLFSQNDLKIFMTNGSDEIKIEGFLSELKYRMSSRNEN